MEIFSPLDIWRAPSLAQETKAVISAYENCLRTNDITGLTALRQAIQARIEDLESFYVQNVDDERSVLFEKQRLKLQKLLSEHTAAAAPAAPPASSYSAAAASRAAAAQQAAAEADYLAMSYPAMGGLGPADAGMGVGAGAAAPAAAAAGGGDGVYMRAIRIAEDTRLTQEELVACFTQALQPEMPEVTPEVVAKVFATVTRTNIDGRMSVRDLRQWYISFGKRALREGGNCLNLESGTIITPALVAKHGFAQSAATKAAGHGKGSAAAGGASVAGLPVAVAIAAAAGVASAGEAAGHALGLTGAGGHLLAPGQPLPKKALYGWEQAQAAAAAAAAAGGEGAGPEAGLGGSATGAASLPVLSVPNGMLEFQVRLTAEEYALVQLRRRQLEAEARYTARIQTALAEKAEKLSAEAKRPLGKLVGASALPVAGGSGYLSSSLESGPYQEPSERNPYFYRSP